MVSEAMPVGRWQVPRLFEGRTVVVLATGPSMDKGVAWKIATSGHPVIAVNNGYEYALYAAMLYGSDRKWWDAYRDRGKIWYRGWSQFRGIKVTIEDPADESIHRIGNAGALGYDPRPWMVKHGHGSACAAAHIALHGGARRVILTGCDCRDIGGRLHSFGDHNWQHRHTMPFASFLKGWRALAAAMPEPERIINATPGSAIDCFTKMDLDRALAA